uniref:G-patch domain-containing protein n=1 Tax=Schizophyllum commune (strain H4-8 / FGSC 9210) TaxID=578458 RepID=D8PWB0_SCHCM
MAYNREWDRGKDAWGSAPRPGVRPREEDYYGDPKRRKFNGGACSFLQDSQSQSTYRPCPSQGYDNTPAYDESSYSMSMSPAPQDYGHPGGPAAKKRLVPSEPSPHVIFLGLDPDFNEADHARAFVDPHFPFISVPPPASHGATAAAAYYKALETGAPHGGRRIKIDYSQSVSPQDKGRAQRGNVNDGTRDIGNTQAPVLLFRGLDPLSGPQAIHQAMRNSAGFGKDGAKGMKRIILIKDRITMASFGFGFVEFVDTPSAAAVLANTMSSQLHPNGFRISDKPVAASFAHPHSFQPVADIMLRDEASITSSMSLGGLEGTFVRYWDENATVAVLEFKVEQPVTAPAATKEKEKKKKAKEVDAIRPIQAAPSALPVSDKPVTLSFKSMKAAPTGIKPKGLAFSMDDEPAEEISQDPLNQHTDKTAAARKVAPLAASRKIANNITKWNQVQEELTGTTGATPSFAPVDKRQIRTGPLPASRSVSSEAAPVPAIAVAPSTDEFEFADTDALMCLLCGRQFKTIDVLGRHIRESELHKKNAQDSRLREVARKKVAARKAKDAGTTEGGAPAQPKYRDRALERRALFNQPDFPVPESSTSVAPAASSTRRVTPPPPPPPPALHPGQDQSNVGNKLLKRMGWQEGTGLGVEGEGRVDPIITNIYTAGAGLGASKGREVGKYAEGYSGYLHMVQDSVCWVLLVQSLVLIVFSC